MNNDRAVNDQTTVLTDTDTAKENPQLESRGGVMDWSIFPDKEFPNDWHVEAIDKDSGDIFVAVFSGPDSEERAREYADWKSSLERQRTAA